MTIEEGEFTKKKILYAGETFGTDELPWSAQIDGESYELVACLEDGIEYPEGKIEEVKSEAGFYRRYRRSTNFVKKVEE